MIAVSEPVPPDASVFAAFVGLDWADQKHDLVLYDPRGGKPEHSQLPHTPEAIDEWACSLCERFGGRPVAVCFEQTRGAIAYALLKYDFLVLFPLPPARLKSYRESFSTSGAKDDPTDAALLADYLLRHRDQLRVWRPDSPATRELLWLAEARRDAVNQRTRLSNQLTAVLKRYYPQALVLVGEDVDTPLACDFLSKWPTLTAVQAALPATLRKFYYAHSCRSEERIAERLELARSAVPLTTDAALLGAGTLQVQCLVAQLRALHKAIAKYEARLAELMEAHPDAALFRALPGAGPALAPRLLAAFGTDRERFQSAAELQTLSGVAPVTERSGKRSTVRRRWACPKFLLQTFHEFAYCSSKRSVWARAFYLQQRAVGKGHHAALRTLAFKWIRILFRCWKTNTPYHEQRYLDALRRHSAPLLTFLPTASS
ncbi:MAG TPA: IS110 family transposase [Pirellulaceae bacterium]|nr:IS110 family transposase [Pirellulaceae bacterium]